MPHESRSVPDSLQTRKPSSRGLSCLYCAFPRVRDLRSKPRLTLRATVSPEVLELSIAIAVTQPRAQSGRIAMLTRRKFLGTTIGAGVALATGACATQPVGKRMIVDAQVHLWKANGPDYPWNPGAKPQLPEPFTVERVVPRMDEAGVDRVVIVPPALNDVNSYALEAVRRYPNRFAVMGRIPLQDPKSAALLPGWKNQPGMLGVRLTFNTPETLAWLSDGTADWFWPEAEKNRLPVMFLAFGNVHRFGPIAQRHPGLPLIIDHMGVNTAIAKEGKMAEKIGDAVALAKYPNVGIKMSNLVNASLEPY